MRSRTEGPLRRPAMPHARVTPSPPRGNRTRASRARGRPACRIRARMTRTRGRLGWRTRARMTRTRGHLGWRTRARVSSKRAAARRSIPCIPRRLPRRRARSMPPRPGATKHSQYSPRWPPMSTNPPGHRSARTRGRMTLSCYRSGWPAAGAGSLAPHPQRRAAGCLAAPCMSVRRRARHAAAAARGRRWSPRGMRRCATAWRWPPRRRCSSCPSRPRPRCTAGCPGWSQPRGRPRWPGRTAAARRALPRPECAQPAGSGQQTASRRSKARCREDHALDGPAHQIPVHEIPVHETRAHKLLAAVLVVAVRAAAVREAAVRSVAGGQAIRSQHAVHRWGRRADMGSRDPPPRARRQWPIVPPRVRVGQARQGTLVPPPPAPPRAAPA